MVDLEVSRFCHDLQTKFDLDRFISISYRDCLLNILRKIDTKLT